MHSLCKKWGITALHMADLLWYLLAFAVVLGARGDAVLTRNENEGLQDGRHQRFPCVREARVTSNLERFGLLRRSRVGKVVWVASE